MASKRNRMKVIDQRTGRLARAVQMVEDGEIRGLYVRKGEEDREHPQKYPKVIPPDRAQFARKMYDADLEGSWMQDFRVGCEADPETWLTATNPVIIASGSTGTIAYTDADTSIEHEVGY